MGGSYPRFEYAPLLNDGKIIGIWRGSVQPIRARENLLDLLDDLHHDRPVRVVGDEVQHLEDCAALHCNHEWQNQATDLRTPFDMEVRYDGGLALPRCYVLSPRIPPEKRCHMWNDAAICAFLASENVWVSHSHTVADYIPHALIWLVKWMVYDRTSVWIGAQHQSNPQYHLALLRPKQPCWCGSGRPYRKCHRRFELMAVGLWRGRH